jgi:hypothetical protein
MKRAAVFGMVVVVVASAWTILLAQSSPVVSSRTASDPGPPATASAPAQLIGSPVAPLTPLQQRFIDLATKKSRLMTEEQLQQSVNQFDRDVEELNAWSKIEESEKLLRDIVDKHPQSRAAATARAAIQIIDQGRPPNSAEGAGSPPLVPIPDRKFDRRFERETPFNTPPADPAIPSRAPKV